MWILAAVAVVVVARVLGQMTAAHFGLIAG
jgi:hypothetical protein